jgi:hypothetical protein
MKFGKIIAITITIYLILFLLVGSIVLGVKAVKEVNSRGLKPILVELWEGNS